MRSQILFLFCVMAASTCGAVEPYEFTIPGRGWALQIDLPPLSQYEAQEAGAGFRFMGASEAGGIVVSFYVEESSASDSQKCREDFWAHGSTNPMIVEETISLIEFGGSPGVAYVIEGEYQGLDVKSQNLNLYIAHGGTCIDLHLSRYPYVEGAEKKLAEIASSASIQPLD